MIRTYLGRAELSCVTCLSTSLWRMQERISPLLTDQYQIAMVYSYFLADQHLKHAVFEMFFRVNPFKGAYAIFAGLDQLMEFLVHFKFTDEEIEFVKTLLPQGQPDFFEYLQSLDFRCLTVRAPADGTTVFANEPIVIIEGPLGMCQLIETTLLVLCNFATLVTTNACRMRMANHPIFTDTISESKTSMNVKEIVNRVLQEKQMLEFGLRRAQGPNGGISASKYAIMGGFNSTSNVLTCQQLGIKAVGTMAHAYILSFTSTLDELLRSGFSTRTSATLNATFHQFAEMILQWKDTLFNTNGQTSPFQGLVINEKIQMFEEYRGNECELSAFAFFAFTQPTNFLALIDTYDVLNSGLPNFIIVGCALMEFGQQALGVRLDSGDLAYLSIECKRIYSYVDDVLERQYVNISPAEQKIVYSGQVKKWRVCVSNDITEEVLVQLNKDGAQIDSYGIGTHLVTCKAQPSLGGVYKLVEIDGIPRMKMTESIDKATLPCAKDVYRLYLQNGEPYCDLIQRKGQPGITAGKIVTCIHPHDDLKRVMVRPARVERLHQVWLERGEIRYPHRVEGDTVVLCHPNIYSVREYVLSQMFMMRQDYKRYLYPGTYKVSVTAEMNTVVKELALQCKTVLLMQ